MKGDWIQDLAKKLISENVFGVALRLGDRELQLARFSIGAETLEYRDKLRKILIREIVAALPDPKENKLGVHLSHCNFGENAGHCKYGDDNCPALTEAWSWFGRTMQRSRLEEVVRPKNVTEYLQYVAREGSEYEKSDLLNLFADMLTGGQLRGILEESRYHDQIPSKDVWPGPAPDPNEYPTIPEGEDEG